MSKDTGIELSPKHGLNPTMCTCFWCGETKGIAILGRIDKADSKAPREMVMDYDPCDKCKEYMEKGLTYLVAEPTPMKKSQPPIHNIDGIDFYPRTEWMVTSCRPNEVGRIQLISKTAFDTLKTKIE